VLSAGSRKAGGASKDRWPLAGDTADRESIDWRE